MLACLRRALLHELADDGVLGGGDPDELWDRAVELGCPLLSPALDVGGPEPGRAVRLACLTDGNRDLGTLYQRLQEFRLDRKDKALTASVARTDRRRSGSFFTPEWMARRLASMALEPVIAGRSIDQLCRLSLLDPACGDGRLLTACIRLMLDAAGIDSDGRPEAARRLVAGTVRGIDLDPVSAALARCALWRLCDPGLGPVEGLDRAIVVGDSICPSLCGGLLPGDELRWDRLFPVQCGPGGIGFDALVANPPFEVLTGFARRQGLARYVARIRKSGYSLALSGNINTYRLFLERALDLLAEDGRLAFVLPFGFLMDRTAAPLRRHMLRRGWVERVEVFPESSRVFEQVGQSVILLAAQKSDRSGRKIEVQDGADGSGPHRVAVDQIESLDPETMALPVVFGDAIGLAARMRALNGSSMGELAEGRVGELDQTKYRGCMRSEPDEALLVRGAHLSAFSVHLDTDQSRERWVDRERFFEQRGGGRWSDDLAQPRVVQTGIVNMEAARRLVAAEVPAGVVLGNSVNYWVPRPRSDFEPGDLRAYLLGLLNSTPLEWRFRLTSSNNNINLYEVRSLPLPRLARSHPAERIDDFVDRSSEQIRQSRTSPLEQVRRITAGRGAPGRDDRTVARLIGRVARMLARNGQPENTGWIQHVLDYLVNWHLGLDEPDLERMLTDVPARAWRET